MLLKEGPQLLFKLFAVFTQVARNAQDIHEDIATIQTAMLNEDHGVLNSR